MLIFSFKAFFDGLGRTHLHLIASTVMTLFNIALNFPIYGWEALQIPAMGVEGAAIASAISSWVGLAVMIGQHAPGDSHALSPLRSRARGARHHGPHRQADGAVGVGQRVLMVGFLLFVKGVSRLDAQAGVGDNLNAAATTILMYILGTVALPLMAFGSAATAVSQALGEEAHAARAGWEAVRAAVLGLVIAGFAGSSPSSSSTSEPQQRGRPGGARGPHAPGGDDAAGGGRGPGAVPGALWRGRERLRHGRRGRRHAGVLVPMSWLLGPTLGYGLLGCWAGGGVYVAGLAIAMAARFAGRSWREIEIWRPRRGGGALGRRGRALSPPAARLLCRWEADGYNGP